MFSCLPKSYTSLKLCAAQKPSEDSPDHQITCFSSLAPRANSWAQVVFPEACHLTHRKWSCSNGEVGASTALLAGGSRLGMPSGFLLTAWAGQQVFHMGVRCKTLFGGDHSHGPRLLCRVESNLSLHGLWLLLLSCLNCP